MVAQEVGFVSEQGLRWSIRHTLLSMLLFVFACTLGWGALETKSAQAGEAVISKEAPAAGIALCASDTDATTYFYNQLSTDEKIIYKKLKPLKTTDVRTTITVKSAHKRAAWERMVEKAQTALEADDPTYEIKHAIEGFQFKGSAKATSAQKTIKVALQPLWLSSSYEVRLAKAARKQIINTAKSKVSGTQGTVVTASTDQASAQGEDRYAKIRKLCNFFRRNMAQDQSSYIMVYPGPSLFPGTFMGPFCYGNGYSQGISAAFKSACDGLDIPCIRANSKKGASWVLVQMEDGKWYVVDPFALISLKKDEAWASKILLGALSLPAGSDVNASASSSVSFYLGRPEHGFKFPAISKTNYQYTGPTTDFSYCTAGLDFKENGSCATSGHRWGLPLKHYRSCTVKESHVWTCAKCGKSYKVVTPGSTKLAHQAGTTQKKGCFKRVFCANCGKLFKTTRWRACKYNVINDGFYKIKKCTRKGCGHQASKKKVQLSAVKANTISLTLQKSALVLKWGRSSSKNISYQVCWSTNKSFKNSSTVRVKSSSAKTLSKKIAHLKSKQTYYVKVRALRSGVSCGEKVTVYSAWSKVKSGKTK